MRSAVRFEVAWQEAGLRLIEPTLDEVRAAAPALAAHYNEPTNRALLANELEHAPEDVVDHYEAMWAAGARPFLLLRDGALVGDADLRHVEARRAEYAILVGPRDAQAKGLGTKFSTMALALAFGPLGLEHVVASVRPDNAGSLRMFAKLGYSIDASPEARRLAEAPDDVVLSMRAAEFHDKHALVAAELCVGPRADA